METIHWEVKLLSPPEAWRHCKKCGQKTQHRSSGRFRVNAQQKTLDVWLIYQCADCKGTWKLAIWSRAKAGSASAKLLEGFMQNDAELARQYAMDAGLLKKNGASIRAPAYTVGGNVFDLAKPARVVISCCEPVPAALPKVIRKKLALSQKVFNDMVRHGKIRLENGRDIHKSTWQSPAVVVFAGE